MREKIIFVINFVVIRTKMLGASCLYVGGELTVLSGGELSCILGGGVFGFTWGDLSWGRFVLIPLR